MDPPIIYLLQLHVVFSSLNYINWINLIISTAFSSVCEKCPTWLSLSLAVHCNIRNNLLKPFVYVYFHPCFSRLFVGENIYYYYCENIVHYINYYNFINSFGGDIYRFYTINTNAHKHFLLIINLQTPQYLGKWDV